MTKNTFWTSFVLVCAPLLGYFFSHEQILHVMGISEWIGIPILLLVHTTAIILLSSIIFYPLPPLFDDDGELQDRGDRLGPPVILGIASVVLFLVGHYHTPLYSLLL